MRVRNRAGKPVYLVKSVLVNAENMPIVMKILPQDQNEVLRIGDMISVIYFSRFECGARGTITIWNGTRKGAISLEGGSIWGEWDEERHLLVTDMHEETWSAYGVAISGKVSYNIEGMKGIFSSGTFYIDAGPLSPAA